jgi:hypothetical protein
MTPQDLDRELTPERWEFIYDAIYKLAFAYRKITRRPINEEEPPAGLAAVEDAAYLLELLTYFHLMEVPYSEYLESRHWREKRSQAVEAAKGCCALCDVKGETLQVHHRTYEHRGWEKPEDLIVLCRNCHAKFHNKLP